MSKIYNKYLELKEKDSDKLYLFHCGKFYIFVSNDADLINNYVVLKRTSFASGVNKCGFPENVLDDYLKVFKNHNLKIEVIEEINEKKDNYEIIKKIKRLNLNKMTPIEALDKLYELQREIYE